MSVCEPSADALDAMRAIYERGQYVRAYREAQGHGPLRDWRGGAARVLAGRLAGNLGAPRLGAAIHCCAWRESPRDADVMYYYGSALAWRHGPLRAWRFLRENRPPDDADDRQRADLWSLQAMLAADLRDFDAADELLDRAEQAAPDHPWLWVERAAVLERRDAYPDALAAADQALKLRPMYRPAVQQRAHLLVLLNRDDEALAMLDAASQQLESYALAAQLARLQLELDLNEQAGHNIERAHDLAPLIEKDVAQWIDAMRFDAAYRAGEFDRAAELAGQIDNPYFKSVKDNMAAAGDDAKRIVLDVPFVRQHHVTCAPATLSALSRLWSMPADHLGVAEEICYDGTPHASERKWAQDHGWAVREFTLSWDAAVALLDRGVAFTLTTTETTSGHLQAVIGYDSRKKVLLVRDPYVRETRQFLAEQTIERYAAVNPRAMAMVPAEQATLLDGLDLPDAPLWDSFHDMMIALNNHRRDQAQQYYDAARRTAPEHRMVVDMQFALARYDADPVTQLESAEWMLNKYEGSGFWSLVKSNLLAQLGRDDENLALLSGTVDRKDAEPVFMLRYAQMLRQDASQWPRALRLVRRAMRIWREDAETCYTLGGILWDLRRFEDALEAYRFAACLNDKDEHLAGTYFNAARHLKRQKQALTRLRRRFEQFGDKSAGPARTLFWALADTGELAEAFTVLDGARRRRADDGEFALFAAEMYARRGRYEQSRRILDAARGRCRDNLWLRAAATLAYYAGKPAEAHDLWRQVLERQPMAVDAHRELAQRLNELEGRPAAIAHLQHAVGRFPYQVELNELLIDWLSDEDVPQRRRAVQRMLEHHPNNAWARRELASLLAEQQRIDDAMAQMEHARRLAPDAPAFHNVMGAVQLAAHRIEDARASFRRSLGLDVDNTWALTQLMRLADGPKQRKAELDFFQQQMREQTTYGEAILAFQRQASDTLEPQELLDVLKEGYAARPDLWQAWSALAAQHMAMKQQDLAAAVLERATARFPLNPRLWMDLAEAYHLQLNRDKELNALRRAMMARPDWMEPLRALSEAYEREGQFDAARKLLDRAVTRDPGDVRNHAYLANALWRLGQRDEAIALMTTVCRREPRYQWAWGRLDEWAATLRQPQLIVDMARRVTQSRPGDANSWLVLANVLDQPDQLDECLAALDRAASLDPRNTAPYDRKAAVLAHIRRFDEARDACFPNAFGDRTPINLRGRAAWVEAQRGNLRRAVDEMRLVLRSDDAFYWGWRELADWCSRLDDKGGLLAATAQMVRLQPNNPDALTALGEAKLENDDRPGAIEAFERAFALDAQSDYAGYKLFELLIDQAHHQKAGETLERRRSHIPVGEYHACRVMLLAKMGALDEAMRQFRQLIVTDAERWCIGIAMHALNDAQRTKQWRRTVTDSLTEANLNEHAVAALVDSLARDGAWNECDTIVHRLEPHQKLWAAAMMQHLSRLADARAAILVRKLMSRYGKRMRADDELWAQMGHALLETEAYAQCVKWMADWRQRRVVNPWMLNNLSIALRELGRTREAHDAVRHALALPTDHSTTNHELWLAADLLLDGDARAAGMLEHIDPSTLAPYYQALHTIVQSVASVLAADPNDGATAYRSARRRLAALPAQYAWMRQDKAIRRTLTRAAAAIARARGGLGPRIWSCWLRCRIALNFRIA